MALAGPVTRERFVELEEEVVELREEVAYLRSELGVELDEHRIAFLRERLSVTPTCARLIQALYQAKGRPLSVPRLLEAMRSHDETGKGACVRIYQARQALGPDAILTSVGQGYSLSSVGAERLRALFSA